MDTRSSRPALRALAWAGLSLVACAGERAPGAHAASDAGPTDGGADAAAAPSCWREMGLPPVPAPVFAPIGEGLLDPEGRTARYDVTLPAGTDVVALRVTDPSGGPTCVLLDTVVDPTGSAWVTPASGGALGSYCLTCPQRVSIGIGYGLFVLPSNDHPPAVPASLGIIAAERECPTFLSYRPPPGSTASLRVEGLFRPAIASDRPGVIALGLVFQRGSALADEVVRAAVLPEALALVNRMLAPGALEVSVARSRVIEGTDPLELTRGDYAPLDALHRELLGQGACPAPADELWVPVVFAGCIRLSDPLQQETYEPDALTPGIPDGLPPDGRAHGIFVKGRGCQRGATPSPVAPSLLAKLLAHELGHYLGLYHSVEEDGTTDQLADTDAANIMYARPLTASAQGFSPGQLQVMRRHPAVRWQGPD